jgi:hypothetical protein
MKYYETIDNVQYYKSRTLISMLLYQYTYRYLLFLPWTLCDLHGEIEGEVINIGYTNTLPIPSRPFRI